MKTLVVNAGSSTIKFNLFDIINASDIKSLFRAVVSHLDGEAEMKTILGCKEDKKPLGYISHTQAIVAIMNTLQNSFDLSIIDCIAYRVVHGGGYTQIQDVFKTKDNIYSIANKFTKAHARGLIDTVEYFINNYSHIPQYFDFDTLYHIKSLKPEQYTYALPQDKCKELGIRKYGEHGLSHNYIALSSLELFGHGQAVISCHLGSGSSISAIYDGECIDNSMGLTPIAGVVMATRCGNIDPSTITYMMKEYNLSPDQMDELMNLHSGLKALCGVVDMRKVISLMENGDKQATLAYNVAINSYVKSIGSRLLQLGDKIKSDLSNLKIIFTAGIGENSPLVRSSVAKQLRFLGLELDENKNHNYSGGQVQISKDTSRAEIWVVPTNEEIIVAKDVYKFLNS